MSIGVLCGWNRPFFFSSTWGQTEYVLLGKTKKQQFLFRLGNNMHSWTCDKILLIFACFFINLLYYFFDVFICSLWVCIRINVPWPNIAHIQSLRIRRQTNFIHFRNVNPQIGRKKGNARSRQLHFYIGRRLNDMMLRIFGCSHKSSIFSSICIISTEIIYQLKMPGCGLFFLLLKWHTTMFAFFYSLKLLTGHLLMPALRRDSCNFKKTKDT